jgi:hypothetical protein
MVNRTERDGYAADIATIANGATHSTVGVSIACNGLREMFFKPRATGANASSAGNVEFYVQISLDEGTTWSTPATPYVLVLSTNVAVKDPVYVIRCGGATHMRIQKIINKDATYGLVNVNASFRGTP